MGFSLIFFQFSEGDEQLGDYLLMTHNYLYGDFPDLTEFTPMQIAFFIVIATFLTLILMNMLIALMGDTYARVQQSSLVADNLEKISLIREFALLKLQFYRYVLRRDCNTEKKKNVLLILEEFEEKEDSQSKIFASHLRSLSNELERCTSKLISDNETNEDQMDIQKALVSQISKQTRINYEESKQSIESLKNKTSMITQKIDELLKKTNKGDINDRASATTASKRNDLQAGSKNPQKHAWQEKDPNAITETDEEDNEESKSNPRDDDFNQLHDLTQSHKSHFQDQGNLVSQSLDIGLGLGKDQPQDEDQGNKAGQDSQGGQQSEDEGQGNKGDQDSQDGSKSEDEDQGNKDDQDSQDSPKSEDEDQGNKDDQDSQDDSKSEDGQQSEDEDQDNKDDQDSQKSEDNEEFGQDQDQE